ncbi:GNAT family N-acetyltransferase [Azospirillum sp. RWY-5-1]|uniref:GNAT family N-acetyltransferase n=1 Tax=Azospirillum oleiclasticum TaxID=2735135 RepID=A0ABX2T6M6_9PROT|nr:GNAT family N-acetyltransferase [Azospirillum oleiclasticum]NYZ12275.1 GNAT family N-acetyltransferase [Azospirillum oleiclasticum]NYZ19435.1 GNAT family N-acetyltransferase [Azospirillum oleiclasticum]
MSTQSVEGMTVELQTFEPEHREGAQRLSRHEQWPHRPEDWTMALSLSHGLVAVDDRSRVVGTVLMTPYSDEAATINMVIVDPAWRGKGLGRRLMDGAMALAGERPLRLVATRDGLPLYERLGFRETGRVLQHQGVCRPLPAPLPTDVTPAAAEDRTAIAGLDRLAVGADRGELIDRFAEVGRFLVLRTDGAVTGFAALRDFGRGRVIGPVVAPDLDAAKRLMAPFMTECAGTFLRVDTTAATGLAPWLAECGLDHVGGGVAMQRPVVTPLATPVSTFALASQAFG